MSRKLKLDVEDLSVATFDPVPEESAERGTVKGNEAPPTWEFCTWASYCPTRCADIC